MYFTVWFIINWLLVELTSFYTLHTLHIYHTHALSNVYHTHLLFLLGTVPSELCDIGTLATFVFQNNAGITCYADCLSFVTTLATSGTVCPSVQDIGICGIIAATDIASITNYDEWACTTSGFTLTDPCAGPWTGITCTAGVVDYVYLHTKGISGR